MRVFLASIPLEGRKVVVVGGGEPGAAKARLVSRTPAELVWYAPDQVPPEAERPQGVAPLPRWPAPAELDEAILVFLAVFDAPETAALAAEARARGALVNVVDRPALCDFHTPALVDRGEVVIGIATGGSAPILARDLRARIEAALPEGLEILAELAREIREVVKAQIADPLERRRYWERAFRGRAADLAAAGEVEAAREELRRLMTSDAPAAVGGVWLVQAPADPDLLTLRALRILQNADLVVHAPGTPADVVDCVRRDARRIEAGPEAAPALIAEAVAQGLRVARLTPADPAPEAAALNALGLDVHVGFRS